MGIWLIDEAEAKRIEQILFETPEGVKYLEGKLKEKGYELTRHKAAEFNG